jgi:hypothetical protein
MVVSVHIPLIPWSNASAYVYADVGGGHAPELAKHSLAKITLEWMVKEALKSNSGILFDANCLQEAELGHLTMLNPALIKSDSSRSTRPSFPTEEKTSSLRKESSLRGKCLRATCCFLRMKKPINSSGACAGLIDQKIVSADDMLPMQKHLRSPSHDQLKENKFWWLLEYIPWEVRFQDKDDKWATRIRYLLYLKSHF